MNVHILAAKIIALVASIGSLVFLISTARQFRFKSYLRLRADSRLSSEYLVHLHRLFQLVYFVVTTIFITALLIYGYLSTVRATVSDLLMGPAFILLFFSPAIAFVVGVLILYGVYHSWRLIRLRRLGKHLASIS